MPRPDQMNINVATWGRLLKKNINLTKSVGPDSRELDTSGRRNTSVLNSHQEVENTNLESSTRLLSDIVELSFINLFSEITV